MRIRIDKSKEILYRVAECGEEDHARGFKKKIKRKRAE